MSEWKECRLGDMCNIRRGSSPRPIQNFLSETGMPWIKIADATATDSPYISKTKQCIIPEGIKGSVEVHPGDFIVSNSATPGLPRFVEIDACIHDGWLLLSDLIGIDKWFLFYKFYQIRNTLVNQANGSVFQNLKTDIVKDFIIKLPPLAEQKKIAGILSALDEKIETNRKINARLEELAQALFKSWFIDFEPFGGKMPEDWKIVKMSEVIEDIAAGPFGSKLPKACFTSEGTPIIDGANLKERIVDETFSKFVSPSKSNELGRAVAHRNDFVVTISGTIGQIAYIYGTSKFSDYLVSQRQFRFSLKKDKVNKHYISLLFANNIGKQKILSFGNQVGVPALSQPLKNFKNVEIILPGMIIQNSFGEIIESIDSLICKNKQESARLTEMRDTLLPKLMSGELIPE